jgi:hypothetical protein
MSRVPENDKNFYYIALRYLQSHLAYLNYWNIILLHCPTGAWGGLVFKAQRYYSDGLGIDSRRCHWIFQ